MMMMLLLLLLSFHPDGVMDCRAAEKNDSGDLEEQRLVDRFSLPLMTNAKNDDGTTGVVVERQKRGPSTRDENQETTG